MGVTISSMLPRSSEATFLPSEQVIHELAQTGKLNIYIRRLKGLGDVLMAALVVRTLKEKLSSDIFKVHLVTSSGLRSVLLRLQITDSVITEEEIGGAFIVNLQDAVDFMPRCKEEHRLDLMARIVGLAPSEVATNFTIKLHSRRRSWAIRLLKPFAPRKTIAFAPWATAEIRSWPKWKSFLKLLLVKGYTVVLLHNERVEIHKYHNLINLTGRISTMRLFSILAECDAAVVVDSGILHACGFLDIPFVGLFGPIDPKLRVAYYRRKNILFLEDSCPICPCWDWQEGACLNTNYYLNCMKSITPRMVFSSLEDLLGTAKENHKNDTAMESRSIWSSGRREFG